MFKKLKNLLGRLIGWLEIAVGLKYPVRHYRDRVDDSLWRGSRLREEDYEFLWKNGWKTVVNLCAENLKGEEDEDPAHCKKYGLRYVLIPVVDNTAPTREQVQMFLDVMDDPKNYPVFVHCQAGIGRTGTFVACYQISRGFSVAAVLKESTLYGKILPCQEDFIRKFGGEILEKKAL